MVVQYRYRIHWKVVMVKQNKGEWSEFTTKLEILKNNKILVASVDSEVQKYCVVRSIEISNKNFELLGKSIYQTYDKKGETQYEFIAFNEQIKRELTTIHKKVKTGRRSFSIREAEKLASFLKVKTCSDYSHNKGDIVLSYIKQDGSISDKESFSIKSFVGNNPTILNSSIHSTRIKLRITGLSDKTLMTMTSKKRKVRENINEIVNSGGSFRFVKFSDTLGANLGKLDAQKQVVFAVIAHFRKTFTGASKLKLIKEQSKDYKKETFELAMKRVLRASITGMMPSEHWDGCSVINDNLILKQNDGSCLAFLDRSSLEDYLFDSCYIDTPSQSKHRYGYVYKENNEWFIDLNFQIRLAKSPIKIVH